jgi:hypothetical protein
MFSTAINTLEERAAFIALLARRSGDGSHDFDGAPTPARRGHVRIRGGQVVMAHRVLMTAPVAQEATSVGFDLAALAGAFTERLHAADDAAYTDAQSEDFALALSEGAPRSRRSLYYVTKAAFVPGEGHEATFNRVFAEVFGAPVGTDRHREHEHEHRPAQARGLELAWPVADA